MKLRREDITKLAHLVVRHLREKSLAVFKGTEAQIAERVESVIFQNLDQEQKIEDEVKKIMEQYKSQIASGAIDPQKAYMMIKKQVAKERKFVL